MNESFWALGENLENRFGSKIPLKLETQKAAHGFSLQLSNRCRPNCIEAGVEMLAQVTDPCTCDNVPSFCVLMQSPWKMSHVSPMRRPTLFFVHQCRFCSSDRGVNADFRRIGVDQTGDAVMRVIPNDFLSRK